MTFDEARIYHATGFLRGWDGRGASLGEAVERYIREWQESIRAGAPRRAQPATAETDAERVSTLLRTLGERYVFPTME